MRSWSEVEREHAGNARRCALELAAAVEQLVSVFERLDKRQNFGGRAEATERQFEVVKARLESLESAAVSVRNIADFRAREPDHPGTP